MMGANVDEESHTLRVDISGEENILALLGITFSGVSIDKMQHASDSQFDWIRHMFHYVHAELPMACALKYLGSRVFNQNE
jgi:hypothetical protein